MEEILASIRKIISEDQNEPVKPVAQFAAEEAPPAEAAVLELDQEVKDDGSVVAVAVTTEEAEPSRQAGDNGMSEMTFETGGTMKPGVVELSHEDIIPDTARSAVGRAFASLDSNQGQQQREAMMPAGGNLDAAFERAVQSAFAPAIYDWIDARGGDIMEQLKPLIRQWMDDNLPALIENAVRNEIARAVRNRGR